MDYHEKEEEGWNKGEVLKVQEKQSMNKEEQLTVK